MEQASALYRLLGDEARLRLLRVLDQDRFNVKELTGILGLAQSGVSVLGVNIDREIAPPRALLKRLTLTFPVAWDREGVVARAWNPDALPTTYILDRDGVIRSIQRGMITDLRVVTDALAALAAPTAP